MTLKEDKNKIKSCLYIVSTPIGNLDDITFRAIKVLKNSNVILCEDTRVSKRLLSYYEIQAKLISNYKFNEKKNLEKIINIINNGLTVSLISDAGTPSLSDPGRILINRCVEENIPIIPIPGASAITTAISISGFSDQFYFHGFLSDRTNQIRKEFETFKKISCSLVFFISAQKLNKKFRLIKEFFSEREILICRELTKIHETFYRGKVSDIDNFKFISKGEVTVVISEIVKSRDAKKLNESDKKKIKFLIKKKTIKDIVGIISQEKNISKSEIYNYCLHIKNEK